MKKPDWMKRCSGINCDVCTSRKNKGAGNCLEFNIKEEELDLENHGNLYDEHIRVVEDLKKQLAAMKDRAEKAELKLSRAASLLDAARNIVEIWSTESQSQKAWKIMWVQSVRNVIEKVKGNE
jgi:hypothetical protein